MDRFQIPHQFFLNFDITIRVTQNISHVTSCRIEGSSRECSPRPLKGIKKRVLTVSQGSTFFSFPLSLLQQSHRFWCCCSPPFLPSYGQPHAQNFFVDVEKPHKNSQLEGVCVSSFFLFFCQRWGREKEERNIHVREKHQSVASCMCPSSLPSTMGTKPTTQAYALTGNRTGNLSLCRMKPNKLSHTGQGCLSSFKF